jgi:ubiquitin carboxyl-terminal hydrolase L5
VYGLIFLFKWQANLNNVSDSSDSNSNKKALDSEESPQDLFFAKQVTTNACATQAILSVLFNADATSSEGESDCQDKVTLGQTLDQLKSFTMSFPPDIKGEAIGASEEIRAAHNSFSRRDAFLMDDKPKRMATEDDDVFHFIAYVPHDSDNKQRVYELDGLQAGPILCGEVEENVNANDNGNDLDWLQVARSAIQTRIEKYAATEIKFNLMALTADKRLLIQSKLKSLTEAGISEGDEAVASLQAELANEEDKRHQWDEENERRRHNYLPLCYELLKALAGSGKLPEYTEKANKRMSELRDKK